MDTRAKIKVCGLKRKEDIEIVNTLDVDYIGFVFAPSKRQVTLENAKILRGLLRPSIKVVGVFVNEEISTINSVIESCKLDIVQLHGEESPSFASKVLVPVWKAISVSSLENVGKHKEYPMNYGILLDTLVAGQRGGTGKTFDWRLIKDLSEERFVILAGGLTPDNVEEAIKETKPHVVDVSSGVEVDGYKDINKIKDFIRSVRSCE